MKVTNHDLIWTKLKSGKWWPAITISTTTNIDDFFLIDDPNVFQATLLGCQKTVTLSSSSALDQDIAWKSSEFTEKFINQEIDDSLITAYRSALSIAATSFPQYFDDPSKYMNKTIDATIDSLKRSISDEAKASTPLKYPKLSDDLLCRPITCSSSINSISKPSRIKKRADVILWDDYFMSVAFLSAMRSKDPSTQVGACIVNDDKRIVGIGYNGFPRGKHHVFSKVYSPVPQMNAISFLRLQ
jgi:hypothetical protein